jgi:hypothetical protein
MKRGSHIVRRGAGTEVGLFSGALSPYISWTRSLASTPPCAKRSRTVERAF